MFFVVNILENQMLYSKFVQFCPFTKKINFFIKGLTIVNKTFLIKKFFIFIIKFKNL
jgi:hypothetical protein